MLQSLRVNTTLKTLDIYSPQSERISDALSSAIQQLLEASTSIACFEISIDMRPKLPPPIARGIIRSASLSELRFAGFDFMDNESAVQFRSILQNKPKLTCLRLHLCDGGQIFREAVMSTIGRSSSQLRCFEFFGNCLTTYSNGQIGPLLQAVKKSNALERFAIGEIGLNRQLELLTRSIPSMRVKELVIHVVDTSGRNINESILEAVKNNYSLRSVTGHIIRHRDNSRASLFDDVGDEQRLAFFLDRNERVEQWVKNPEKVVDRKVWPKALHLAQRAGPNSLFRGLRSVFESEYVNTTSRKRKRH